MSNLRDPPFKRDEFIDKPGIVGARWWHEGLVHANPVGRRAALQALLVGGGLLAVGLVIARSSTCSSSVDSRTEPRKALDVQKQYGWDFGARAVPLTFDGMLTQAFNPALLARLPSNLAPARAALRPYFVATLLQSCTATPQQSYDADGAQVFVPLSKLLKPIFTAAMDAAYRRGRALAALVGGRATDVALIVDLVGPESVAFAAGAAEVFDPVFAIDNWPHPFGVVPAHLTLAAAAYYQPLFAKTATTRPASAPPLFVLDRARLTPYTDEGAQFDNRHLARLPSVANLAALGVRRVLYVAPLVSDVPELDDLNTQFVHYAQSGVTVKIVGAEAFGPQQPQPLLPQEAAGPGPTYYYAWDSAANDSFWVDYPWLSSPASGPRSKVPSAGRDYVPRPRQTPFTVVSASSDLGAWTPMGFGMVPVVVATATGAVLGAQFTRNGSWSRSSGGWGG